MLFTACNENEEHDKITADYAQLHNIDEKSVSFRCYGEFDGVHVMLFNGLYGQAFTSEIVDDVVFHHSVVITFTVYNRGNFCGLQEAFENGFLTHENLLTVRKNHKAENKFLYDNQDE